jgi:hypothetical protein
MNGRISLLNTKDQVEQWDSVLDEYESSIGLPAYKNLNSFNEIELNDYFAMNRDAIEKLTPDDCTQIALRLSQYALFLQRTLNREIARYNWAEETIKEVIADDINNYKGYGYIEKAYQAIKHNDKASSLNKIKKYAKQRMDRLSYLANNIKNISDIVLNIQKIKVKNGS